MSIKILLIIFFLFFIQACGGGSSSSEDSSDDETLDPIEVLDTSYKNFKGIGLVPQTLPASRSGDGPVRTFGDFTRNGRLDMFVVIFNSPWPPTVPEDQNPAIMEFWEKRANGSFELRENLIQNPNEGCSHPRKAIVADFNQDETPDVFVACHGFDADPFPGEPNTIVLSQSDGTFRMQDASVDIGFFHGAAAANINGDSYPDVVVVDNNAGNKVYTLLNNGAGTFTRDTTVRFPAIFNDPYYTIELVDVDGDDFFDALIGGHEHEGADTVVLVNDGSNDFSSTTPIVLPSLVVEGNTVLDFAVTSGGSSRDIWINRTDSYNSRVLQKIGWPDLASTVPYNQNPEQWLMWILPSEVNGDTVIASEDASFGIVANY